MITLLVMSLASLPLGRGLYFEDSGSDTDSSGSRSRLSSRQTPCVVIALQAGTKSSVSKPAGHDWLKLHLHPYPVQWPGVLFG